MYKAAIAFLIGLILSVSGSAWATTFKDGVISSDNVVEKPIVQSAKCGSFSTTSLSTTLQVVN